MAIRIQPLRPQDAWAVGWDGRVAAVRSSDYHVEWIAPDGQIVRGDPVPFKPVKVRQADKEEWVEGVGGGLRVEVAMRNGQRQMSFSRGGGGGGRSPDIDSFDWPETKPAFVPNGVWVTPEGNVWVERYVPAGEPSVFDVFGADANLKGRVTLPAGRDIVGFGRGTIYLIETDDDGLQWLERHKRSEL